MLRAGVDELLDPRFEAPALAPAAEGLVNEQLGRECVAELLEPRFQLYVHRLCAARATGAVRPDVDPGIALELFVSPLARRRLQRTAPITHACTEHPRRLRTVRVGPTLSADAGPGHGAAVNAAAGWWDHGRSCPDVAVPTGEARG